MRSICNNSTTLQALILLSLLVAMSRIDAAESQVLTFKGGEGLGQGKHIVLISGDEEYRSEESLPMLAKILSKRHGFKCTVIFAIHPQTGLVDPNYQNNLPGLEELNDADLAIVATRFRTPPDDQMKPFENYLNSGRPIIGLRTATHGFRGKWEYFGMRILGEQWVAHHGKHKKEGTRAVVEWENAGHPILRGVQDICVPSDVYTVEHLTDSDTILLRGAVTESLDPKSGNIRGAKNEPMMPLAWLRNYKAPDTGKSGQAFCTTAGASVDFLSDDLRRLVVNASLHLVDVDVPARADVRLVDPYVPSFYGFFKEEGYWHGRGLRITDFALGQSPAPVDPPGTPECYWTQR